MTTLVVFLRFSSGSPSKLSLLKGSQDSFFVTVVYTSLIQANVKGVKSILRFNDAKKHTCGSIWRLKCDTYYSEVYDLTSSHLDPRLGIFAWPRAWPSFWPCSSDDCSCRAGILSRSIQQPAGAENKTEEAHQIQSRGLNEAPERWIIRLSALHTALRKSSYITQINLTAFSASFNVLLELLQENTLPVTKTTVRGRRFVACLTRPTLLRTIILYEYMYCLPSDSR